MLKKPLALLLALCVSATTLPLHAGSLDSNGLSARVFIELPFGSGRQGAKAPSFGFTLNHRADFQNRCTGFDFSGAARSCGGANIALVDVHLDAPTAKLRRLNIVGQDLLTIKTRLNADGASEVAAKEQSSAMTGAIVLGVAVIGLGVFVAKQTEQNVNTATDAYGSAIDVSIEKITPPGSEKK